MRSLGAVNGDRTPLQLVQDANARDQWPLCHDCGQPLPRREAYRFRGTPEQKWIYDACDCRSREAREGAKRATLLEAITSSNPIPERYADASLAPGECAEDVHNRAALIAARAFIVEMVKNPSGKRVDGFGLYSAPNGTGKTFIAYGVVRALREAAIPALIYHVKQIDREAKAAWKSEEKERALFENLCTAPLLVIDDLGKQWAKSTGDSWIDSLLDEVVNERWLRCLPIIVTANFEPAAFESDPHFGGSDRLRAVVDRLHGIFSGGRAWIELTGQSRRLG